MARQVDSKSWKKYMGIFSLILMGCANKIYVAPEDLNEVVVNNPDVRIVTDPTSSTIVGFEPGNEPITTDYIYCHCYSQRECHEERPCFATYCIGCAGINENVPTKIICL